MEKAGTGPRVKREQVSSSRIGRSLRSARLRAGWTREVLAQRSGLSFAAITQIESGRRQEVRVSSLIALARALEVSVDYLVGSDTTTSPNLLGHRALVYDSDAAFVAFAAAYLAEGLARSDCVLAVTTAQNIAVLRDALGGDASRVEFADSSEWYSAPSAALSRYRTFVSDRFERGAPWIRILGEPVWTGRSAREVEEWARYESTLNLSFAPSPATIVCPYDARSLPEEVLAFGRRTHPEVAEAGSITSSRSYQHPEDFLLRN